MIDPRLTEGIHLFNQQEFFEAHEVIESLWLETKGKYRNFYKGLIQSAAALHHLKKENHTGANGLFKTSLQYLSEYEPECLGVDVRKLIQDMKTCFAAKKLHESLVPIIQICNS